MIFVINVIALELTTGAASVPGPVKRKVFRHLQNWEGQRDSNSKCRDHGRQFHAQGKIIKVSVRYDSLLQRPFAASVFIYLFWIFL